MFKLEGHHIGDPWFLISGGVAHMWFLTQPTSLPPNERGHHWDVGYAVSSDLRHWAYQGIVLERGWGDAWDSQKLATGSAIERDGLFWMAYTGHRRRWLQVQRAGLAWSKDLSQWHKLEENPVTEAKAPWYDLGKRDEAAFYCHWRDPFLVEDGPWVYQLVCAQEVAGDKDVCGVVARARSRDMRHWEVIEPLDAERMARQMECPCMHRVGNRWYLIFSCYPGMMSDAVKRRFPEHTFHPATYSMVSDHQWGPYRLHGLGLVQPLDAPVRIYAGQLLCWEGRWFILGFVHDAEYQKGEMISDPIPVQATPEGIKQT